ncbi:hypothetical protein A9Q99_11815 [Gammaproteobacteria bacterium 45_16_T64]|nr:hypothetical protein A9Q99_11815 [Gammaproteobacteria bacterium 45_16_T64]
MKKLVALPILLLLSGFLLWAFITYPKVGHIAYDNLTVVEAKFRGLEKHQVDIGELTMSIYRSENKANKPTLLMLHGYSSDKDVWPRFASHLIDDFNIIIPDMAGHGETGFSEQWNYRMPVQADRLAKMLEVLAIPQVHVIGNSMGGFVSAHFAKRHPDRTLSAFLIDPAGVYSPTLSRMGEMILTGRNPFEINSPEEFAEFYPMTMANPPWLPGVVLDAIGEKYEARRLELRHIYNDFHEKDMLDNELAEITAPVLLLWGGQDQLLHVDSASVWQAGVPNIQVEIWEEIGHMSMLEAPARTAALYQAFLSTLANKG